VTPEQLSAYIQAATLLVTFAGVATDEIRAMFGATDKLTEEQLNLIIAAVEADATRRKALATAEAGGII
jgi:hypothetical protein